jgi:hypothetical protein
MSDGNARYLHVELLFLLGVDLELRLVDFKKMLDDRLVEIVLAYRVLYLSHVVIEPANATLTGMRVDRHYPIDQSLRFCLLHHEGHHLVH